MQAAGEYGKLSKERNSVHDYSAAMERSGLGIYIIDPESHRLLYCNRILKDAVGYDPTGELCYEAFACDGGCGVSPMCPAARLKDCGTSEGVEFLSPQKSWLLVKASRVIWEDMDAVMLISVDITRQKQVEAELRRQSEELSAVIRQSGKSMMRYNIRNDCALIDLNEKQDGSGYTTITGFSRFLKRGGFVNDAGRDTMLRIGNDLRRGVPSGSYNIQVNLSADTRRWYHTEYSLLCDEEGVPDRSVFSFYDNTEQHEKEISYRKWQLTLESMRSKNMSYMEVNLTKDIIERDEGITLLRPAAERASFSGYMAEFARSFICPEDVQRFRIFHDRERMLGAFYSGHGEDVLELRELVDGRAEWFRINLQMISDPFSGGVKAFLTHKNVDEEVRERERLTREAERDSMTGLYNRATTERLISEVLSAKTGENCALFVIDLDDLRGINSSLGHPEGDRALKAMASIMATHFRRGDIIGRIGGDEFAVLLRDVPEMSALSRTLTSFMRKLGKIRIGALNDRAVRCSVGGAMGVAGIESFRELYRRADLALFHTKASGKNNFTLYVPEMEEMGYGYAPAADAEELRKERLVMGELKKLMQAMAAFFPLVVSANLTKNTYHLMEYMAYTHDKVATDGSFEQLIAGGVPTFHPEDRESFVDTFNREKLLRDYAEGKRMVNHRGRQLGDDGKYHWASTVLIFVQDDNCAEDVCSMSFSHVTGEPLEDMD